MASHTKLLRAPDETRKFEAHGHLDLVNFGNDAVVGKGTFEPGWKWSTDVKPLAGTKSCTTSHTGYCISGRMTIRMDDGDQFVLEPGAAFHIPPGHDAWVEGKEPCLLIDIGMKDYAKPH